MMTGTPPTTTTHAEVPAVFEAVLAPMLAADEREVADHDDVHRT